LRHDKREKKPSEEKRRKEKIREEKPARLQRAGLAVNLI
jgi:hypothetical protein